MTERCKVSHSVAFRIAVGVMACAAVTGMAFAQSADPFESGANNLVTSLTTLATPIAVLLVMALGVAAAAGRISWSWPIGILVGIGLLFAAPSMVTWMKGLFSA